MTKKISVIIPCYNVAEYIDRCIESLVNQTIGIHNLELIFVDDASTDSTVEKLMHWESLYPESILIVTCEENGRQGRARNIGFQYATADYISYVDSDDWVDTDIFETLYNKMISANVDVVGCEAARDCGDGNIFATIEIGNHREELFQIDTVSKRRDFLELTFGFVCAKLYRKQFLIDNNIYFPEGLVYEDNFFGTLITYHITSFYVIDEVHYHYFTNMNSTVTTRNVNHHLDRLKIECLLYDELKARGFDSDYLEEMNSGFLKR